MATTTPKRTPKSANSVTTVAPDVLGNAGRARVVADLLLDLQGQMARNEAMMVANEQTLADPSGLADAQGEPLSYGERQETLAAAQARLVETYASIMPEVEKLLVPSS